MIESNTHENLATLCQRMATQARDAALALSVIPGQVKNAWLTELAERLRHRQSNILAANEQDIALADQHGLKAAQIDRLRLSSARLATAIAGLEQIAQLPDPVGEVREGSRRPNGLEVLKVGVPLGVIFFIYESRPNVTLDAAGLCVKSGNAVILRGGKEAMHTNQALYQSIVESLSAVDLPSNSVQLVPSIDREAVGHFLQMHEQIDLTIPRGGESLIRRVAAEATMPVLKHYQGNCHVYIDRAADLAMGQQIVINAKCQRPGVCNAMESLLVHQEIAATFLPSAGRALQEAGVELRGCARTRELLPKVQPATPEDHAAEFLDLILSIQVVSTLGEAVEHIRRFGSGHTEAIVTQDLSTAKEFTQRVDAAAVLVNASTRFHDGFALGLGAEIGISTDRFHARGPCGLRELTTTKYIITGSGQIRR